MTTRRTLLMGSAAVALLAAIALAWWRRAPEPAGDEQVRAACSGCHAFPPPDVLPRFAWRKQIEQMAFLSSYLPPDRGGSSATFPVDAIVAWYEARAPERLPFEPSLTRDG